MQYATSFNALHLILAQMGGTPSGQTRCGRPAGGRWPGTCPWGVVTFEKMTKPEAVSTLVLTNTPQ